jgi:D-alanyl-D-alanine carboxypeptidase (penicillin-binding protein 5/6)
MIRFKSKLRRIKRIIKEFVTTITSFSVSQALIFLFTPFFILVYLSMDNIVAPVNLPVSPKPGVYQMSLLPQSKGLSLPDITANQIFIMDQNSKSVLFAKSATDSLYPASTTKIMTALVALSTFPLDKVITVTRSYPDGQNIHLSPSEQLTVDQLLHALLIQSANDAAEVLAENYPGGRAAFVDAMNVKATQLHLANTHFLNPTGLDEEGHFSTALDLVRLSDFALKNPHFARLVSIENSVVSTSVSPHLLTNVNQLLGKIPGVIGVKTGQTDKAGQSLITLVNRANHPVLLSVMGSKDRFADTTLLIDWVYTNFYWVDPDSLDQLH